MDGTIVYIPSDSGPVVVTGVPWPMELETMQALVGGHVQTFPIFHGRLLGWCNEDGWAKRLPLNFVASQMFGRQLLGNVYLTGWLDPAIEDASPIPEEFVRSYRHNQGRETTIEELLKEING
jgi:hypothetical protein